MYPIRNRYFFFRIIKESSLKSQSKVLSALLYPPLQRNVRGLMTEVTSHKGWGSSYSPVIKEHAVGAWKLHMVYSSCS